MNLTLDEYLRVSRGIEIFTLVKFILFKLAFSLVVVYLAMKTRKALEESDRLSKTKQSPHKRIFYFCLIPIGINVLFLIPECMNEI